MRWLLLVLAGCWSNAAAPPAPPQPPPTEATTGGTWRPNHVADRCGSVVPHVYEYVRADPSSAQFPSGMVDELEVATLDHCRSTAWSAEALDCYEKSSNLKETPTCFALMTEQQRDSWQAIFKDVFQRYQNNNNGPTP